jgi:hypothetical protein
VDLEAAVDGLGGGVDDQAVDLGEGCGAGGDGVLVREAVDLAHALLDAADVGDDLAARAPVGLVDGVIDADGRRIPVVGGGLPIPWRYVDLDRDVAAVEGIAGARNGTEEGDIGFTATGRSLLHARRKGRRCSS